MLWAITTKSEMAYDWQHTKNKINKLLPIVDVVQTIDSFEKAVAINKRAERINKIIEALIEINIGSEITKSGLPPEYDVVEDVVKNG